MKRFKIYLVFFLLLGVSCNSFFPTRQGKLEKIAISLIDGLNINQVIDLMGEQPRSITDGCPLNTSYRLKFLYYENGTRITLLFDDDLLLYSRSFIDD